jgi:cell division septum initiation protein DivIVA
VGMNGTEQYNNGSSIAVPSEFEPTGQSGDQRKALQVLTVAQRTANEHIAISRREAEHIRTEARIDAEKIIKEAQGQADVLQGEAEKILAKAHFAAEKTVRDTESMAELTAQNAKNILNDTRARAEEILQEAQAGARDMRHRAQQVYDDVVGGLSAKRETLQRQIEALEQFEQEYRARLVTFMQQQLRSLWVDQPQAPGEIVELNPAGSERPLMPSDGVDPAPDGRPDE